jgi:hypothetical protein
MDAGEPSADGGRDSGKDANASTDTGSSAGDGQADADDGAIGDSPEYQCEPPPGPDGTLAKGAACCGGLGVCAELSSQTTMLGIGDCNAQEDLRCVAIQPDAGNDGGANLLTSCRMKLADAEDADPGYEGRCVPECLTRPSTLEQGECGSGFVCAPCFNPVTAEDTGVCRNGGDEPAEAPPSGFSACGDALGYCISSSLAGESAATLPQLSCSQGSVCAPRQRVLAPDSCFARCDSVIAGAGACIPAFLVPEMSRSFLQQSSCMPGELCSPCVNPTTAMRTGACD